jgi:protocatechuate 3,4-dioxygenase beta subunit
MAGTTLVRWLGCGGAENATATTPSSSRSAGSPEACAEIPDETAGPFPADGTNGPNVLASTGIVRRDITSSFGTMSGTAAGTRLSIDLKLVGASSACGGRGGYAVYLWHCDRGGNYSIYMARSANYLRGVQEADQGGTVTFESIFPGCYPGRWPHVHFEVYSSLMAATSAGRLVKTSQIALIEAPCREVYATAGYTQSAANLSRISLQSDGVFRDGPALELPTMTGNVHDGYLLKLTVGVPS